MKWRAHRNQDGEIDQNLVVSDTHTVVQAIKGKLYISFRRGKGKPGVIIGRWSTPAKAKECCEADYEGKPFPPDTVETYPPGRPTLDAQETEAVSEPGSVCGATGKSD